jgi:hypothetical protein
MGFFSITHRKRSKNPIWFMGVVFSILGGGLMILGGVFFVNTFLLIRTGERVDAIVVDTVKSEGDRGSDIYTPVVSYSCGDTDVTKQSNMGSSYDLYSVGEHIFVYCDPDEPEHFVIDTFVEKYFGVFFMIFGSVFLIVGLGVFLYVRVRAGKITRIKAEGIPVQGTVILLRVVADTGSSYRTDTWGNRIETMRNSGHTEVTVSFTHPLTGETTEALADSIPGDVTSSLKIGDKLTVYADSRDPGEYWVDAEKFMQ